MLGKNSATRIGILKFIGCVYFEVKEVRVSIWLSHQDAMCGELDEQLGRGEEARTKIVIRGSWLWRLDR